MKKDTIYNFESIMKLEIEQEFYKIASKYVPKQNLNKVSIVTGPNWFKHISNASSILDARGVDIYETDDIIFSKLISETKDLSNIRVYHKSIELAKTAFIDCDLTSLSDLKVLENTLLNQIVTTASAAHRPKAFIGTVGRRTGIKGDTKESQIVRRIFGLLGASILTTSHIKPQKAVKEIKASFKKEITFNMTKGRIIEYKCYSYNAGGGPMLTFLIVYK